MDFTDVISGYVATAHKHEDAFLEKFCARLAPEELVDCFMGGERTRLTVRSANGTEVPFTISTGKFIMWCEEMANTADDPGA